jgi:carbohydrate diacid regulator
MLTSSLAQSVAAENAAVTGLGILITDPDGTVIGSSDPTRLGSFHEASVDVVRTRMPASHTAEQAAALRGVRPGLTLPLLVDGEAVGTVGITGSPARIRRFGPLVRRHTEILLRESAALRSQFARERAAEDLIRDLADDDRDAPGSADLHDRVRDLGCRVNASRIAIVFATSQNRDRDDESALESSSPRIELFHAVRDHYTLREDISAQLTPSQFIVLHHLPEQPVEQAIGVAVSDARSLLIGLRARHPVDLRAALGGVSHTIGGLRPSLHDALDALALGTRIDPAAVVHRIDRDRLRMHQVLTAAGRDARARLEASCLSELRTLPDWHELRQTIIAWCEAGFRLVDAARALHVHRNTMVYRIAKIERIAGRDLRRYADCLTIYLACLADQLGSRHD